MKQCSCKFTGSLFCPVHNKEVTMQYIIVVLESRTVGDLVVAVACCVDLAELRRYRKECVGVEQFVQIKGWNGHHSFALTDDQLTEAVK